MSLGQQLPCWRRPDGGEASGKCVWQFRDRSRWLHSFTEARLADGGLWGPDFGYLRVRDRSVRDPTDCDSFGNLEVSPLDVDSLEVNGVATPVTLLSQGPDDRGPFVHSSATPGRR